MLHPVNHRSLSALESRAGFWSRLSGTLVAFAAFFFAGCATQDEYQVKVNTTVALADKPKLSYKVVSVNPELDETSLRYLEAERYVKTALSSKGLYEAPRPDMADVVIELDYGMKGPIPRETVRTHTSYEPIHTDLAIPRRGGGIYSTPHTRSRMDTMPVDRPYLYTEVVYEKYINMRARENAEPIEGVPPKSLWSVEVSTVDDSNDLRKYLPIMASVGMDYIGTDTGGERTVEIEGQDDAVVFVKKGL